MKLFFNNLKIDFVVSSKFARRTEQDIGLSRKTKSCMPKIKPIYLEKVKNTIAALFSFHRDLFGRGGNCNLIIVVPIAFFVYCMLGRHSALIYETFENGYMTEKNINLFKKERKNPQLFHFISNYFGKGSCNLIRPFYLL